MIKALLICVAFSSLNSTAFADDSVLVDAPVEKVFVPQGFDDNDKVELIVHGFFTSSCYKMGPAQASVNEISRTIEIQAQAFYYPQALCTQLITPFIKSVELDRHLIAGIYTISVKNSPNASAITLKIVPATRDDADDYFYAQVNSVSIDTLANGTRELVLKGQHPYLLIGCVKLDKILTVVGDDNTIVIQPIAKIVYDDECRGAVNNRFEYRQAFEEKLESGNTYLIHVRVLNGNAINALINAE